MSDMRFQIGDTVYDAGEALNKVSLSTLYELKVRTGYGVKSLAAAAQKVSQFANDPLQLLEDKEAFQAFRIIIWLSRKHAGENNLSLDQATDFPIDSLMLLGAPEDEAAAADVDPKQDSAADAGAVEAVPATSPTT
jgi:hypothetical protein